MKKNRLELNVNDKKQYKIESNPINHQSRQNNC